MVRFQGRFGDGLNWQDKLATEHCVQVLDPDEPCEFMCK